MKLEEVGILEIPCTVFRFANPRDDERHLIRLGVGEDAAREMLDLLSRRASPGGIERLIDGSFEPWNKFGPPYGGHTRFSNGTWPACYTALEARTAEDEIKYHRGKAFFSRSNPRRTIYYHLIQLKYFGRTIDLRPHLHQWPFLASPDEAVYPDCQSLARDAILLGAQGLFSPSARRKAGTNVPVFARSTLSEPASLALAAFVADPASSSVKVEWKR
jgi:hypothetical protein